MMSTKASGFKRLHDAIYSKHKARYALSFAKRKSRQSIGGNFGDEDKKDYIVVDSLAR